MEGFVTLWRFSAILYKITAIFTINVILSLKKQIKIKYWNWDKGAIIFALSKYLSRQASEKTDKGY